MSDILVRVPLSGQTDFHPLALAPGLPMLDARKLTYQVLLGWFGDLLAEPMLDDDGVTFHLQKGGQRQKIVQRSLATEEDLSGTLAGDYERLRKALFDVRPVSPSERLIFNRLQPPIGNFDGYLYKVQTRERSERLVWCWGFQRRTSDGSATLCSNEDCARLYVKQDSVDACPGCGAELAPAQSVRSRSRFPVSAAAAAVTLVALTGGTYWLAATATDQIPVRALQLANLTQTTDPTGSETTGTTSSPSGRETQSSVEVSNVEPSQGTENATGSSNPDKGEGRINNPPEVALAAPDPVDGTGSSQNDAVTHPVSTRPPQDPPRSDDLAVAESQAETDGALRIESPDSEDGGPDSISNRLRAEPDRISPPQLSIELPQPDPVVESTGPNEPAEVSSPRRNLGRLSWHEDYLAGYRDAISRETRLLIVFRSLADPDSVESFNNGLANPELVSALQGFARLKLPVNTAMPGQDGLLLEHRSFRHLGVNPGIVVVDLSERSSPNYGRVVSALPLPPSGKYPPAILKGLLALPSGSIGERSLQLALTISLSGSRFDNPSSETLNALALRNSRLQAQAEEAGRFEPEARQSAISGEFGDDAVITEFVFATAETTTIHDAAVQAVSDWVGNSDAFELLKGTTGQFGLGLVQSPTTGRWFATCLIVTKP